jgi:hypothetical protein
MSLKIPPLLLIELFKELLARNKRRKLI